MALINQNIKLPNSTKNNTNGLYGSFVTTTGNNKTPSIPLSPTLSPTIPTIGGTDNSGTTYVENLTHINPNEPTTPIAVQPTLTPTIGVGNNSTGGLYGDMLIGSNPTTPSLNSGLTGIPTVKPVDMSGYFDSSVVGTVAGGFTSGGSKSPVDDEGVITYQPNADDVTFDNNGFKGTGEKLSATVNVGSTGSSGTSGSGTSYGDNVEGVTPTPTEPTDEKDDVTDDKETAMTYAEWIEEQKKIEEQNRLQAHKDAEVYAERAAADAQAGYMLNKSTYGVNAETMAKMGLTGGGYSDYLNAQAYAQKRGEIQDASATEMALKADANATYSENISNLDGSLIAYNEEKKEYKDSIYNGLLTEAQNPDTSYTEEGIKAIAEKAGLSEEEIKTITDLYTSTQTKKTEEEEKAEQDAAVAEEEEKATYSAGLLTDVLGLIESNGGMSAEYINSLAGLGMSEEDIAQAKTYNQRYHYNAWKSAITGDQAINTSDIDTAYNDGLLDETQYNDLKNEWNKSITESSESFFKYDGATLSYDDAKNALNLCVGNSWTSEETKNAINSVFKRTYATDIAKELVDSDLVESKTVDIYSKSYKASNWGDFSDINDSGSGQGKYIKAIEQAVKDGKIKEGQLIAANYGKVWDDCGIYVYIGDGVFVEYDYNDEPKDDVKALMYFPDGYKYRGKWKTGYVEAK